ncbi:MAG: fibronectin type III domain-containing protein [Bacteroidia bacterium]|nr:fibronectin type III domain-containing protein [Bacteroidia bacterium]MCF8425167.1 fibronectin type III domain-containing protein [Bacteroidia bacterium]MCF8447334.1 fibronectin type III domain-containing protein [Bacteroidia bacterium]
MLVYLYKLKIFVAFAICFHLIGVNFALGQTAALKGESLDGTNLKLIWFFKEWPKKQTGFVIKKKLKSSTTWENLHEGFIIPEIKENKSYTNLGSDQNKGATINEKLHQLIADKKTKPISHQDYINKILSDPNALKNISFAIALDYDFALINGFALVDDKIQKGVETDYALFSVEGNRVSNKPIATYTWDGITLLETKFEFGFEIKKVGLEKGIQFIWTNTDKKLDKVLLRGFCVYKKINNQWVRLTKEAVFSKMGGSYTYFNLSESIRDKSEYGLAFKTSFNHESKIIPIPFDPNLFPESYNQAEIISIECNANLGDKYPTITWKFPPSENKYIKGFILEKAILPGTFRQVTPSYSANPSVFIDTNYSPPSSYIKFRISTLYKDGTKIPSTEHLFFYLPSVNLYKPKSLTGKFIRESNKSYIQINWLQKPIADTLTESYQLYASNRFDQKMYLEASIPKITDNNIRYPINNTSANYYKFVLVPISKYKTLGEPSDTLTVYAPSGVLPSPRISNSKIDSLERITINWNYKQPDIKGFRVYQNGNMVASEFQLKGNATSFTSAQLKLNTNYSFTIQAVSNIGVESPISAPVTNMIYVKFNKTLD